MKVDGYDIRPGANLRGADLSGTNLRDALMNGAELSGANLRDALLRGANLSSANLYRAELSEAELYRAYLSCANLCGANLSGADLRCASIGGADLSGANLIDADLRGANLRGAYLRDAQLNWQSHDILAEILRDAGHRRIAGLVLISLDWCWDDFLHELSHEEMETALGIFAAWEGCPYVWQDGHAQKRETTS